MAISSIPCLIAGLWTCSEKLPLFLQMRSSMACSLLMLWYFWSWLCIHVKTIYHELWCCKSYLDNVIPGEHGAPKPFYFFLTAEYWGYGKKKTHTASSLQASSTSSTDVDVQEEGRKTAAALLAKSPTGVQVLNLSKTYPQSIFHKSAGDIKVCDHVRKINF